MKFHLEVLPCVLLLSHITFAVVIPKWKSKLRGFGAGICAAGVALQCPTAAFANVNVVGEFSTSGLVFKDTLKITQFDDPKVEGVSIYLSEFERPITEKLSSAADLFSDPSSTSLTCSQVSDKVKLAKNIPTDRNGEEIFEDKKGLFFKTVRVRRLFDPTTNTIIYASYSTRLDKNTDSNKARFKSSLCAVHIASDDLVLDPVVEK